MNTEGGREWSVHEIADCQDCKWHSEARDAKRQARRHHEATGHRVSGEDDVDEITRALANALAVLVEPCPAGDRARAREFIRKAEALHHKMWYDFEPSGTPTDG